MNLDQISNEQVEALEQQTDCIGFFVFEGSYYWIIDWEAHFNLDHDKNLRAYLQKGHLTKSGYDKALTEYRGGIPTLTFDKFAVYSAGKTAKIVSTQQLTDMFFCADEDQLASLAGSIEGELSFNTPMPDDMVVLRKKMLALLPSFYVNFDRKIFMHMVQGRSYDEVLPDGWWGAECDFEHMIPISYRYWVQLQFLDSWAVTNFRR